VLKNAPAGADPHKGQKRHPRQPDMFRPRESVFKPIASGLMMRGGMIVGIEEDVGVEEDYRWKGPSICSISSQTLS
jgi:hypothetical protein